MKYPTLPLPELLNLIDRYYDCSLSDEEESQLRRAVAVTPHVHPAIDEIRAMMGFRQPKATKRRHDYRAVISVAATIAIIITLGAYIVNNPTVLPTSGHCIAYADGHRLTNEADIMRLLAEDLQEFEQGVEEMNSDFADELNDIAPLIEAYESPESFM